MLSDFFEPFCIQDRHSEPDGFGGVAWTLTDGAEIMAGISTVSTAEAQIAYQTGTKTIYTIVHRKTLTLHQGDHVRRMADGRLYRITSNSADMATPAMAQEQYCQVSAEVIDP